jgi:hypothetical protein
MSALGQKRTLAYVGYLSALPPKANIAERHHHVRFVPKADSCTAAKLRFCNRNIRYNGRRRTHSQRTTLRSLSIDGKAAAAYRRSAVAPW